MPERDVLETDHRSGPHDPGEPADPLGDDRISLVRHRRGALLALAERLLHLGHLGARQVTDLDRETLERGGRQGERGQQVGVTVALDDLRRGRLGLEAEAFAGHALDLGVDRRVVADGARELPDAHALERKGDAPASAVELEGPDRELEAERRRLRMHPVGAADRDRQPVLLGPRPDRIEGPVEPGEDQLPRGRDLQRERGVHDVRRGEAVVEPAPFRAELRCDRVDESRGVVVRPLLDLGHPLGARRDSLGSNRLGCLGGHDARLRPAVERRELDLEPALELALVRPDAGHLRSRVA